jgi:hypothetical protein
MTCEHLIELEQALIAEGFEETFRGEAWSENVREWVYFEVCLDLAALRARFNLDPCVQDHSHLGTHDGAEAGVQCEIHHDGIMGRHPVHCGGVPTYP